MLMAWGPIRFSVPTYSVEALKRTVQSRVEEQPIIGASPSLHRLGPGATQVVLESTFFPQHFNRGGISMLSLVRELVSNMTPLPLVLANGAIPNVFGQWVGVSVDDTSEAFDSFGRTQKVSATLTLKQDGGPASSARRAAMAALSYGASSVRIGF